MIGNVMPLAISMMTEEDFWDKFNKKHNPKYYYATKNKKKIKLKPKRQRRHPLFKGQS
jgi:hypothetical protein